MDRDNELVHTIETALRENLKHQVIDLNIHATDGTVYLTGFVDCLADKIQAEKVVQNYVPKVRFENNLTIAMNGNISDKELKEQAEDNLRHCEFADRLKSVSVQVEGGSATLVGNVNTLADEIKALEVTRQTIGLKDVVSNLNIETAEEMYDDALLKSMVQQALNDSDLDRHSIIPIVKNGVVTLEGLVDHRYEVEMAGELIANVEGVIKIRNQLRNRQDDGEDPYVY
ncbi:MAG: BON domain-containing protein [Epulopiscium sp.]|nr:BON domain-containing protein [Candidatus Epulonipiscium sp.]